MVDITIRDRWLEKDEEEIEHKLAHLLLESVIFCNNGWWYEKEGISWKKDAVSLHVNVNDTFCYGADAEDITYDEINSLYEYWRNDDKWGVIVWCMKKRKCKPIPRIEKIMIDAGYNIDDLIKEEVITKTNVRLVDVDNTIPPLSIKNSFAMFLADFKAKLGL